MENMIRELREKKKAGVITLLVGLMGIALAFALSGPAFGPGASPLAPVLLLLGGTIAVVGLALIVRKTH